MGCSRSISKCLCTDDVHRVNDKVYECSHRLVQAGRSLADRNTANGDGRPPSHGRRRVRVEYGCRLLVECFLCTESWLWSPSAVPVASRDREQSADGLGVEGDPKSRLPPLWPTFSRAPLYESLDRAQRPRDVTDASGTGRSRGSIERSFAVC